MPSMSSGLVSSRTKMAFLPCSCSLMASCELNTIWPAAPPGPAGNPLAIGVTPASALGSMAGSKSSPSCAGVTRRTASSLEISLSFTISNAICTAAVPFLLPTRHWSIQSFWSSMVNSISSISWKCFSSFFWMASNSLYTLGITFSRVGRCLEWALADHLFIGEGVRIPATTSSPWALIKYSP